VRTLKLKKMKRVHGLHFAPDGQRLLAVGGEEGRSVGYSAVWLDLVTGEDVGRIHNNAYCYAIDSALTRYVLGGTHGWYGSGPVQCLFQTTAGKWKVFPDALGGVPWVGKREDVSGLAFDATGERLAVAHSHASEIRSDPTGVVCELSILRFEPPALLTRLTLSESPGVIAFNVGATRVALTGGVDRGAAVEVYTLATRVRSIRFNPPATVTRCVLFLPDNRLVVANGRAVYVLPPDRPEPLFTLEGHPKQVNAVALTPDGRRILTASHDGSIRAWNSDTGEPGPRFDWGVGPVTALAFAPDGLTCAAAGLNGKVVLWDVDE
jgi:WD40 repeat protein